jgi:2-polyprenyl-6-methoxyphenol hydroxylase-like FAD-dependent oxidoreductase
MRARQPDDAGLAPRPGRRHPPRAGADRPAAGGPRGGRATGRPVRGFPGIRGWLRRPRGPGWALVGDAGYFKDPCTAHGISDALRDAELLARDLHRVLAGGDDPANGSYERVRDRLSRDFFEVTDAIPSFAGTSTSSGGSTWP